jgi:putative flippase GtrA
VLGLDTAVSHRLAAVRGYLMRIRTELGKFGVIGVISWVVDTVVFNAYLHVQGNRYWAAVVSTTCSATLAFIGNRFWTWRDRPRAKLHREYALYAVFNVVGLAIGLACLWISHEVLGAIWPRVFHTILADNVAKQGFGLLLGTMFRFWAYRRFIFPEAPEAPTPSTHDGAQPDAVPAPKLVATASARPDGSAPVRPDHHAAHRSGRHNTTAARHAHISNPVAVDRSGAAFDV